MIRIALIGCKNATADYGAVASRLQGARLAAVVDPDGTLARGTAEALEVPLKATSFESLLRDNADAFDAVAIRRPCGSPHALVARAAETGKHVLLDMPLLLRMPSGDAAIAACRSTGVTFMLGQATRFLPSVAEVKNCLGSGILGAPGLLRIHDWRPPVILNRHIKIALAPRKGTLEAILQEFTDTAIEFTETEEGQDGGGKEIDINEPTPSDPEQADATAAIFEAVLPDVDLANWIFGALPTEVYAAGHAAADSYGYVQVHLGYPDGGMALVDHSMMLPPGSDYFSLSVFGSAGAAYADDHHNMHLLYGGGRPTALAADQGKLHHLAQLQEFVNAIKTGRPPPITADDGHKAAEVVRAVDRSLKSGCAMQLAGSHYEIV